MLYREIIAACSEIHTKHTNTLCGQNVELYMKTQSVPRSKHAVSVIQTSQLMLYREIIALCSQIHTKHTNALCGPNVEFLCVKRGGTYSGQWALRGWLHSSKSVTFQGGSVLPVLWPFSYIRVGDTGQMSADSVAATIPVVLRGQHRQLNN